MITLAGALAAKAVIHTVGPVWQGGGHHEAERLEEAYLNTLQLAPPMVITPLLFRRLALGLMAIHAPQRQK